MLTLKDIRKDYIVGDTTVHALRGVSISFRESEFVSVLGQSGCGKTTLLNIIGGLDQYTDGDLVINGRSTREYKDRDWDTYRNHTIGFVFQSYNLIPHQSVLANVELALTISGVDKAERRERAVKVLERVGLGDQLNKKPNQMSGGQMQRVAIARALINDPDILLADEPTGALDSETSVQIMELLQEIAKDKLVVMVTHNAELAERYSTRIVRLLDGQITGDTDPFDPEGAEPPREDVGKKKPSMSFLTALSLSFNNLKTKKARTLLTAFAGSIGIIGIALILSLSNGIQTYINQVQEDTLSTYPLTIEAQAADLSSMIESMAGVASDGEEHELDAVYSNVILYDLMDSLMSMDTETNDLESFKDFLDENGGRHHHLHIRPRAHEGDWHPACNRREQARHIQRVQRGDADRGTDGRFNRHRPDIAAEHTDKRHSPAPDRHREPEGHTACGRGGHTCGNQYVPDLYRRTYTVEVRGKARPRRSPAHRVIKQKCRREGVCIFAA